MNLPCADAALARLSRRGLSDLTTYLSFGVGLVAEKWGFKLERVGVGGNSVEGESAASRQGQEGGQKRSAREQHC